MGFLKVKSTISAPLLLCAVLGLISLTRILSPEKLGLEEDPYLSVIIIQLVIFALPSLFYCTLRGADYKSRLRIKMVPAAGIILIVCAAILMAAGGGLIGVLTYNITPEGFTSSSSAQFANFAMNSGVFDGVYLLIAFALLPAMTEEFLFRGIILTEYSSQGMMCAVIMSSLMFAMSHFSFVRFPIYFFSGLLLAAVTLATRSVIASIIVHTINNIFVLFFEDFVLYIAGRQNINSVLFIFILACAAFISAIVMAFEASSIYRTYGKDNVESDYLPDVKKKKFTSFSEALFSPTFLILLVLYLTVTYIS